MRSRVLQLGLITLVALAAVLLRPTAVPAKQGSFITLDVPASWSATSTQAIGINARGDIVGHYSDGSSPCNHAYLRDNDGEYKKLADAPGPDSFARAINNDGDIVGYYSSTCPPGSGGPPPCPSCRGYLLSHGNVTPIDFNNDPTTSTRALGINDRGDIVGRYGAGAHQHGFLRSSGGTYTAIDFPGAALTVAHGINDRGDIVGFYSLDTHTPPGCGDDGPPPILCRPFLRTSDGKYTKLTVTAAGDSPRILARGINDRGDIVGAYDNTIPGAGFGNGIPFLLERDGDSSTLATPPRVTPGTLDADAFGINARGAIVGNYTDANGVAHGYLRTEDDR